MLSTPLMAGVYVVAICIVGGHMWTGWSKTVHKFNPSMSNVERKDMTTKGQQLVGAITAGFLAVAVAAHLKSI